MIAPAPAGGAESVVLGLSAALAGRGCACAVAAIVGADGEHPFLQALARAGTPAVPIAAGHRRYRAQARAIAAAAESHAADLVHTHGYHADGLGAWGARIAGRPYVTTLHGFTGEGLRQMVYDVALRISHRRAAAVIAVSRPIVERLAARGVERARIHLIPNARRAIAPMSRDAARDALGIPAEAIVFGWVGRLSREKGADVLLEALARVIDPRMLVSVVGDGPERAALESAAARAGVASRVRWHGLVADAAQYLCAFDALVLSSRTEGTPMVLLEAMAAGVPIVATAVGGVPDMLGADAALLVPSQRADLLAGALDQVVADPASARARAERARRALDARYSEDVWTRRHLALYAGLLAASRP